MLIFLDFLSRGCSFLGAARKPQYKTCLKYDFQQHAKMDGMLHFSFSFRLKHRSYTQNINLIKLGINGYPFRIIYPKLI